MAWLEKKGAAFRIRCRFGGTKHLCALHTSDKTEAENTGGPPGCRPASHPPRAATSAGVNLPRRSVSEDLDFSRNSTTPTAGKPHPRANRPHFHSSSPKRITLMSG
jgi:hypothetical protein